jgi:hypothetical protein
MDMMKQLNLINQFYPWIFESGDTLLGGEKNGVALVSTLIQSASRLVPYG